MSEKLIWIKSSYSGSGGGNCIEVALEWRKSSHSGPEGGNCVEVAACPERVHIRDSKNPALAHLTTTPNAWAALVNFAATT